MAGAFGPGFPAKGMTASANIAYVQMKAILIVKAERAGSLRAPIRSLSAPLMHSLISSARQSLGCEIFNLFFRDRKVHQRPTVRPAAAASCLVAPESCFAVPGPQMARSGRSGMSASRQVSGLSGHLRRRRQSDMPKLPSTFAPPCGIDQPCKARTHYLAGIEEIV